MEQFRKGWTRAARQTTECPVHESEWRMIMFPDRMLGMAYKCMRVSRTPSLCFEPRD